MPYFTVPAVERSSDTACGRCPAAARPIQRTLHVQEKGSALQLAAGEINDSVTCAAWSMGPWCLQGPRRERPSSRGPCVSQRPSWFVSVLLVVGEPLIKTKALCAERQEQTSSVTLASQGPFVRSLALFSSAAWCCYFCSFLQKWLRRGKWLPKLDIVQHKVESESGLVVTNSEVFSLSLYFPSSVPLNINTELK